MQLVSPAPEKLAIDFKIREGSFFFFNSSYIIFGQPWRSLDVFRRYSYIFSTRMGNLSLHKMKYEISLYFNFVGFIYRSL